MNNYEITERGKVIFAVIIVAILIVISVIIISVTDCSGTSPPDDSSVSYTPLPTPGSGFDPDTPTPTPTPDSTPTPTPEPTPEPTPTPVPPGGNGDGNGYGDDYPEFGPVGLNLTEGTMQFIFAPSIQDALDEDTVNMLSEFLTSPKNTPEAKVQVEMPNLSEDDTEHLLLAVTSAFSGYSVNVSEIVYVKNTTQVDSVSFEVKLSFYEAPAQK